MIFIIMPFVIAFDADDTGGNGRRKILLVYSSFFCKVGSFRTYY